MINWPEGAVGHLQWGVRRTLLDYMAKDATFEWTASGGADFTLENGVVIPVAVDADGGLRFTGEVLLSAHAGALTVPLVGARVTTELRLTVADPVEGDPLRITLVDLEPVGGAAVCDSVMEYRFATSLSAEADALFLHNYLPGVAFDDLRVRLTI